jgi:hypothetical protein
MKKLIKPNKRTKVELNKETLRRLVSGGAGNNDPIKQISIDICTVAADGCA